MEFKVNNNNIHNLCIEFQGEQFVINDLAWFLHMVGVNNRKQDNKIDELRKIINAKDSAYDMLKLYGESVSGDCLNKTRELELANKNLEEQNRNNVELINYYKEQLEKVVTLNSTYLKTINLLNPERCQKD